MITRGKWYPSNVGGRRIKAFTWCDGPNGVNYSVEGWFSFLPMYCSKEEFLAKLSDGENT